VEVLKRLETVSGEAAARIGKSESLKEVEELRVAYLGRKSEIMSVLKQLGTLPPDVRPRIGRAANEIRGEIENLLKEKENRLADDIFTRLEETERIDITEPGAPVRHGHLHPITQTRMEIEAIFTSMGFTVAQGPEVETDYYNFEALNIPKNHPARDMQDTIWTTVECPLRTHTSCVQIRTMEKHTPPIRVIAPGRVFRHEETDASHEHTFYQVEGLMVDRGISVANLIAVMKTMLRSFFHRDVTVRLRPGYFPFVEPGFELDINCLICGGKGCSACKNSGWTELLGCGMVHPNVLRRCTIDPEEYSGFAFGMGLDRLVMNRYGVEDIRLFHSGDLRFLEQF